MKAKIPIAAIVEEIRMHSTDSWVEKEGYFDTIQVMHIRLFSISFLSINLTPFKVIFLFSN